MTKNITFERALFVFLVSLWNGLQYMMLEKKYVLRDLQEDLILEIEHIFNDWGEEFFDRKFKVTNSVLEKFCVQVAGILTTRKAVLNDSSRR